MHLATIKTLTISGVNSSKRIFEHATALVSSDTHAHVVVSKFYEVTNTQKKKTPAQFWIEILWTFVYFMI